VGIVTESDELSAGTALEIKQAILAKVGVNHLGRLPGIWEKVTRSDENVNEGDSDGSERTIMRRPEDRAGGRQRNWPGA
jgi:hypothetical protein